MTTTQSTAKQDLRQAVSNLLFEQIFNNSSPAEQFTTLEGIKEHQLLGPRQHLLEGLTAREFHVLVVTACTTKAPGCCTPMAGFRSCGLLLPNNANKRSVNNRNYEPIFDKTTHQGALVRGDDLT